MPPRPTAAAPQPTATKATKQAPDLSPLAARVRRLGELWHHIRPLPDSWLVGANGEPTGNGKLGGLGNTLDCVPCHSYKELVNSWKRALKWTPGLDYALSVMLSSITSTKSVGDQLWVKIIGPASCGKSTLCEAISVNKEFVLAKSTIRGFHSGYISPDGEDHSLIVEANGKTLAQKDGDTLLQAPNLQQILAEARDVYDSVSRTHYRNAQSNNYAGIRMTWILCGTASLRAIDSSELGERFLDCVVMDGIDDDLEDEILKRVAYRTERNMMVEANDEARTNYEPELADAMQLTGGYVDYLRNNATNLLSQVHASDEALHRCTRLGKFVAYMRARPSRHQTESSEREFAARLTSQHVRLSKCLAVVLNESNLTSEVMARTTRIAMDTSRGLTLQITEQLYKQPNGLNINSLALLTTQPEPATKEMLRFLKHIGVVELNKAAITTGARTKQINWVLTPRLRKLYAEVSQPFMVQ